MSTCVRDTALREHPEAARGAGCVRVAEVKQVAQRPRDGDVAVVDVPPPALRPGWLLVANRVSLISAGTERTKIVTGEKNLLQKARARPDLVKKVVDKARVEGIRSAVDTARDRLDGARADRLLVRRGRARGRRGRRGHRARRPRRLRRRGREPRRDPRRAEEPRRARSPTASRSRTPRTRRSARSRCTASARPRSGIGDSVGVIGLGLVGQLAVRLLAAAGCRVVGIDLDDAAVELVRAVGATALRRDDAALEPRVHAVTGGLGLDAVLLCASSASSDPLELAVAPRARPRPHRRRRGDADRRRPGAHVREGARAAHVPLVRARPLRPRLRGARPRPPRRLRPLDGAAQHAGVPRARGCRARRARRSSRRTASRSTMPPRRTASSPTRRTASARSACCSRTRSVRSRPSLPRHPARGGRRQTAGVALIGAGALRPRDAHPGAPRGGSEARRGRERARSQRRRRRGPLRVRARRRRSTRSSPTTASARSSSRPGTRATQRSPPPRSEPARPSSSRSRSP